MGEKRPLGSEARQKRGHSLDVPSFMFLLIFLLSPSTKKKPGWRSVAVRSSSALWYQFLRVLVHSYVTGRLTMQKQMYGVKGHSDKEKGKCGGSKGIAHTLSGFWIP